MTFTELEYAQQEAIVAARWGVTVAGLKLHAIRPRAGLWVGETVCTGTVLIFEEYPDAEEECCVRCVRILKKQAAAGQGARA